MNTSQIGNIGEAKALCKFVELGVPVYIPFGDGYEIDMIAIFNGKANRIQIKTTELVHNDSLMHWRTTKQDGYHGSKTKYDNNSVDYFVFYCIESDTLCLIPFEDIQSETISIRLDSYSGVRLSTMRFANDYRFEKIINQTNE